jgi:uncharacterized repeat protein (TIGR02543 family)
MKAKQRIKLFIILGVEFIAITVMLLLIFFAGKQVYTVTFDLNYDGAPTATTQTTEVGGYISRPADPTRVGYRFLGWFIDKGVTTEVDFSEMIVNSDVTIYAAWIEQVNVTFTYFDMQERMLHKETRTINCDIPSGETRKISVRSWDSNNAFHYYRSQAPLRRQSTRYKVSSLVNYLIVAPQQI